MTGKRNVLIVILLITAIIFIGCENKNVNENEGSNIKEKKLASTSQQNNHKEKIEDKKEVDKDKENEIKTENKGKIIAIESGETPWDIKAREVKNTSYENAYGYLIGEDPLNITDISNNIEYNKVSICGVSVDYPSFLEVSTIPDNQKGIGFKSKDGKIEFTTGYMYLLDDSSPKDITNIYNDKEILYKNNGDDWYAISYKENDNVYYEYGKFKDNTIYTFNYTYPEQYDSSFGDIIDKSYKTFEVYKTV
ncbi:hypothetical protein [Paraclostridium bifermentans]|uniref:hypothetical protein n=1 Tax=Paraclostridium bifermentans TaxID=1490 RepID=UPI001FF2BD13|nr:hypothetical protein [Paraclostridium bifermentans]UOW69708.1 hypothetical protein MTR78_17520 [Paraclostridium bifermentans]